MTDQRTSVPKIGFVLPSCDRVSVKQLLELFKNINGNTDHFDQRNIFFDGGEETDSYSFCVLSSKKAIELIKTRIPLNHRQNLMTTIRIRPIGILKHLLILYTSKFNRVYPFGFALMSHKSKEAYEHVFTFFEKNVFSVLSPTFTIDYEKGMHNALRRLFPLVHHYASHFQFCQAVKQTIRKFGLVNEILGNTTIRSIFYRLLCLPLLVCTYIRDMFVELKDEAFAISNPVFHSFLDNFEKRWINTESIDQISLLEISIMVSASLEASTLRLEQKLERVHSGFFELSQVLQTEEYRKSNELEECLQTGSPLRDKEYDVFEKRFLLVEYTQVKLFNETISATDFIKRLSEHGEFTRYFSKFGEIGDDSEDDVPSSTDINEVANRMSMSLNTEETIAPTQSSVSVNQSSENSETTSEAVLPSKRADTHTLNES
ncbi:hypothetical protein Bhyg_01231 [Pseudolycoriella hygida]|uniref:MULE transposase domain-containing protein n=1 Tax=Pseudolycoriella hygida TaxID=35572 RepID=A0A9Q0N913_9DIPT|nr:hypothetical protein Bhyg_01231 [Pseudolycoriella hygida]